MKAINILVDYQTPAWPTFVEIEDDEGNSISIGQVIRVDDTTIKIRITPKDINQF